MHLSGRSQPPLRKQSAPLGAPTVVSAVLPCPLPEHFSSCLLIHLMNLKHPLCIRNYLISLSNPWVTHNPFSNSPELLVPASNSPVWSSLPPFPARR